MMRVSLNYLRWLEADEPRLEPVDLQADSALKWFCKTLTPPLMKVLPGRYSRVAECDHEMAVFPHEKMLFEKVLIPLHQAKVAFVLGHELGCIALSGMVAEMLAILRFQISPHGTGASAMSPSRQERLFGRTFEQIEHSRRVGILELLNLIDAPTAEMFKTIAKIRNAYLHRFSHSHADMGTDAITAYSTAVGLSIKVLGLGIDGFHAKISPEVRAFIRKSEASSEPPA